MHCKALAFAGRPRAAISWILAARRAAGLIGWSKLRLEIDRDQTRFSQSAKSASFTHESGFRQSRVGFRVMQCCLVVQASALCCLALAWISWSWGNPGQIVNDNRARPARRDKSACSAAHGSLVLNFSILPCTVQRSCFWFSSIKC